MDVVLALLLGENLLEWGGGLEKGGQQIGPEGRVADDGKRFEAMDVVLGLLLGENVGVGRGSRGRGAQNSTASEGCGFFRRL